MDGNNKLHQTLELKDGRKLGYAEFGNEGGIPIFHFHGNPGSRLEVLLQKEKVHENNLNIVAVDRPGIGLSDYKPNRKLLDWPNDIVELADHLGWDKFFVRGISGGGPYAAVCAYKIPERLYCCQIVAGLGPLYMRKKGANFKERFELFAARRMSFLVKYMMKKQMEILKDPKRAKEWIINVIKESTESDKEFFQDESMIDSFIEEMNEAYRSGPEGVVQDVKIYAKPWEFQLSDISPELTVYIWHGERDKNVPISQGREMCRVIPNCKGLFYPEEGHFSTAFKFSDEMIEILKKHYPN